MKTIDCDDVGAMNGSVKDLAGKWQKIAQLGMFDCLHARVWGNCSTDQPAYLITIHDTDLKDIPHEWITCADINELAQTAQELRALIELAGGFFVRQTSLDHQ